jgi:mono/diheme cytochrome c family protein
MLPILLVVLAATASAQTPELARGAQVFAQSCAVGYCHGTAGAANRGPRLAGRGFDKAYVDKVIRDGLPGTAMPGFKSLKPTDLTAVIAYVMNISGGGSAGAGASAATPIHLPNPEPPPFPGPPQAKKGKDLFFDPIRGTRCGTCHAVQEWGAAVGPNLLAKVPPSAAAIRSAGAPNVQTAIAGTERFPALVFARKQDMVQVYDLTDTPPVLRTFATADLKLEPGSTQFTHGTAIQSYTDADLTAIVAYLKWAAAK